MGEISRAPLREIPGYIYQPPETPKAALVALHAFNQRPEDIEVYSKAFAKNGFVVLAPRYTDASDGVISAVRALRKVKEMGFGDYEKIGIFGISLGGTVSLLASTQERAGFVVDVGGWIDLADLYLYLSKFPSGTPQRYIADLVRSTLGEPEESRELYELSSPITYVDRVASRVLILHGSEDTMVPPAQSLKLYEKLKSLGKDVEYHVIEGGGYLLQGREEDVIRITLDFLRRRNLI